MSRGLTGPELAAAAAAHTTVVPLVEVLYDSGPLRLALGGHQVVAGGNIFYASGAMLNLQPIGESMDSTEGLSFEMTGLDAAIITIAALEPYRGRIVRLYEAWLDASYQLVAPPRVEWIGRLSAMVLEEQAGRAVVAGAAEHYEADLRRPRQKRYTGAEQRRRYPNDAGCDLMESLQDAVITWPNKELLKR